MSRNVSILETFLILLINTSIMHGEVVKMKKREDENDNEIVYSFSDDGFDFYTTKAGEDKKAHFLYSKLFKIYETKEFFYMYLNKTGAFIVDKATVDGDISELSSAIKAAAGKGKYIKCL